MSIGEDEDRRVVGYYLNKPCIIKMKNPNPIQDEMSGSSGKTGYEVSLFPWMPLSKDETIPIPADWVITMVDPVVKLNEMYIEDVVNYGKETNKNLSTDKQSDSDKSD